MNRISIFRKESAEEKQSQQLPCSSRSSQSVGHLEVLRAKYENDIVKDSEVNR